MTTMPRWAVSKRYSIGMAILMLVVLSGCSRLAASPTLSPLPAASPLPTAGVTDSPLTSESPSGAVPPGGPVLDLAFDLEKAVLSPEDMRDLFEASYSVMQPYQRAGVRGLQVVYPTRAIEHTTGFAEGFSTQLEIYAETSDVVKGFNAAVAGQVGVPIEMSPLGDASRASLRVTDRRGQEVPAESPDAHNFAYSVIARQGNVLAIVQIRAARAVPAERLAQAMELVLTRLRAS